MSIDQMIGRTVVGATQDGRIWAVYLKRSGEAEFLYSTGNRASSYWYRRDRHTICFFDNPQSGSENCKTVEQAGQGLHWITVGESAPSSQLVMIIPGGKWQTPFAYYEIESLAGSTVIGRTVKDREIWRADFREDGYFRFASSSNRIAEGKYFFSGDRICLVFPNNFTDCRRLLTRDKSMLWINDNGDYISEVIYVHREQMRPTRALLAVQPRDMSSQPSRCTAREVDELRTTCVVAVVGEVFCSSALSNFMGANIVSAATASSLCSAASQSIRNGDVNQDVLGVAIMIGTGGVIGSIFMQSDDPLVRMFGAGITIFAFYKALEPIRDCMERVVRRQCN